jgi:hypothetical protein
MSGPPLRRAPDEYEIATGADQGDVIDPALGPRLKMLRDRLSRLGRGTFEFWRAHGPDVTYGGFHGTLDRAGQSIAPTNKG